MFVPLEGYGQKIEDLFEGEEFAFVRGGVGVGKSTLRLHLARQNPKFVSVPFGDGKYCENHYDCDAEECQKG